MKPDNFGEEDCCCQHCATNKSNGNKNTLNHGKWKSCKELAAKEFNRVALPGDSDYKGAIENDPIT